MSEHQQMQKPGKPDSTFQKQTALTSQNSVSHPASIIQRARINSKSLTVSDVLQLQRTIGNRAVGRLLSEIRNPSKVQEALIQRQELEEEETCPSCVQKQEKTEEEEPLQGKFETIQRQEHEDEEKLQMKSIVQRQDISEEEEPVQGKMIGTIQRQEIPEEEPLQKKSENNTGMPDNLKAGVESLSGIDMSDVRVHYNSDKPFHFNALAYTQGVDIHVAPGLEQHLPHEVWHVVQQKQGRVKPTMQINAVYINDDPLLETEATCMGYQATQRKHSPISPKATTRPLQSSNFATQGKSTIQRDIWRWDSPPGKWSNVWPSGSNPNPPPTFSGPFNGFEYDDKEYEQKYDHTVVPFLHQKEEYMGGIGADKQLRGIVPSSAEIREPAYRLPKLRSGTGLHEIIPTNMRAEIISFGSLIGVQSGARTSTTQQLFIIDGGDVGAHTGFAPKQGGGGGSTHTKGQAGAHDRIRAVVRSLIEKIKGKPSAPSPPLSSDEVINEVILAWLSITPHGKLVLQSSHITGMQPSDTAIDVVGSPVVTGTKSPDPNRLAVAQNLHQRRERVKRRARAHKRFTDHHHRERSPSPPRHPIDATGGGGDYILNPTNSDLIDPIPAVSMISEFIYTANMSSYITQPMREGFIFSYPTSSTALSAMPALSPVSFTATPSPSKPRKIKKKKKN